MGIHAGKMKVIAAVRLAIIYNLLNLMSTKVVSQRLRHCTETETLYRIKEKGDCESVKGKMSCES